MILLSLLFPAVFAAKGKKCLVDKVLDIKAGNDLNMCTMYSDAQAYRESFNDVAILESSRLSELVSIDGHSYGDLAAQAKSMFDDADDMTKVSFVYSTTIGGTPYEFQAIDDESLSNIVKLSRTQGGVLKLNVQEHTTAPSAGPTQSPVMEDLRWDSERVGYRVKLEDEDRTLKFSKKNGTPQGHTHASSYSTTVFEPFTGKYRWRIQMEVDELYSGRHYWGVIGVCRADIAESSMMGNGYYISGWTYSWLTYGGSQYYNLGYPFGTMRGYSTACREKVCTVELNLDTDEHTLSFTYMPQKEPFLMINVPNLKLRAYGQIHGRTNHDMSYTFLRDTSTPHPTAKPTMETSDSLSKMTWDLSWIGHDLEVSEDLKTVWMRKTRPAGWDYSAVFATAGFAPKTGSHEVLLQIGTTQLVSSRIYNVQVGVGRQLGLKRYDFQRLNYVSGYTYQWSSYGSCTYFNMGLVSGSCSWYKANQKVLNFRMVINTDSHILSYFEMGSIFPWLVINIPKDRILHVHSVQYGHSSMDSWVTLFPEGGTLAPTKAPIVIQQLVFDVEFMKRTSTAMEYDPQGHWISKPVTWANGHAKASVTTTQGFKKNSGIHKWIVRSEVTKIYSNRQYWMSMGVIAGEVTDAQLISSAHYWSPHSFTWYTYGGGYYSGGSNKSGSNGKQCNTQRCDTILELNTNTAFGMELSFTFSGEDKPFVVYRLPERNVYRPYCHIHGGKNVGSGNRMEILCTDCTDAPTPSPTKRDSLAWGWDSSRVGSKLTLDANGRKVCKPITVTQGHTYSSVITNEKNNMPVNTGKYTWFIESSVTKMYSNRQYWMCFGVARDDISVSQMNSNAYHISGYTFQVNTHGSGYYSLGVVSGTHTPAACYEGSCYFQLTLDTDLHTLSITKYKYMDLNNEAGEKPFIVMKVPAMDLRPFGQIHGGRNVGAGNCLEINPYPSGMPTHAPHAKKYTRVTWDPQMCGTRIKLFSYQGHADTVMEKAGSQTHSYSGCRSKQSFKGGSGVHDILVKAEVDFLNGGKQYWWQFGVATSALTYSDLNGSGSYYRAGKTFTYGGNGNRYASPSSWTGSSPAITKLSQNFMMRIDLSNANAPVISWFWTTEPDSQVAAATAFMTYTGLPKGADKEFYVYGAAHGFTNHINKLTLLCNKCTVEPTSSPTVYKAEYLKFDASTKGSLLRLSDGDTCIDKSVSTTNSHSNSAIRATTMFPKETGTYSWFVRTKVTKLYSSAQYWMCMGVAREDITISEMHGGSGYNIAGKTFSWNTHGAGRYYNQGEVSPWNKYNTRCMHAECLTLLTLDTDEYTLSFKQISGTMTNQDITMVNIQNNPHLVDYVEPFLKVNLVKGYSYYPYAQMYGGKNVGSATEMCLSPGSTMMPTKSPVDMVDPSFSWDKTKMYPTDKANFMMVENELGFPTIMKKYASVKADTPDTWDYSCAFGDKEMKRNTGSYRWVIRSTSTKLYSTRQNSAVFGVALKTVFSNSRYDKGPYIAGQTFGWHNYGSGNYFNTPVASGSRSTPCYAKICEVMVTLDTNADRLSFTWFGSGSAPFFQMKLPEGEFLAYGCLYGMKRYAGDTSLEIMCQNCTPKPTPKPTAMDMPKWSWSDTMIGGDLTLSGDSKTVSISKDGQNSWFNSAVLSNEGFEPDSDNKGKPFTYTIRTTVDRLAGSQKEGKGKQYEMIIGLIDADVDMEKLQGGVLFHNGVFEPKADLYDKSKDGVFPFIPEMMYGWSTMGRRDYLPEGAVNSGDATTACQYKVCDIVSTVNMKTQEFCLAFKGKANFLCVGFASGKKMVPFAVLHGGQEVRSDNSVTWVG